MTCSRRIFPAFLFLFFTTFMSAPAGAEPPAAQRDELAALVATLEDEQARNALIGQLRLLLEAETARGGEPASGAGWLRHVSGKLDRVGAQLAAGMATVLDLPAIAARVAALARDPDTRGVWFEVLSKLVLVLLVGLFAEWLVRRLLRRTRDAFERREVDGLGARGVALVTCVALDLIALAAFAAAAYTVLPLTQPRAVTQLIALALIHANVGVRLAGLATDLVFAPRAPGLRLATASDETAHYAAIWTRRLAVVGAYGYFAVATAELLGLDSGTHGLLLKLLGLIVTTLLLILVLQNRHAVSTWLTGTDTAQSAGRLFAVRRRLAEIWHIVAIVYLFGAFGVWVLEIEGGFRFLLRASVLSVVVLLAAALLQRGLRRTLNRSFALSADLEARFPGLTERANRYLYVGHRCLSAGVYLVAGLTLLDVWGAHVFEWLSSEAGQGLSARLASIFFIVLGAALIWEVISSLIARYLEERDVDGTLVARSARAKTLLPLLRNAARIVLVLVAGLTVLAELGINIAPLLAGAGVVGLAVGFGAQSLVKDLITGVFILLEDSIAVGDVVDLGGHSGVVESLTVRTVRLRDLNGTVHVIPWGIVASVRNMTRDFSFAVMDVGVAYREDVDAVVEILQTVGATLQADPEYGPEILEPLEVLGLDSFGDSSVNIRVRFKTRPSKQWWLRREFNRRMKRAFDEHDIEIPFPHQTIYFGVDKAGQAPPAPVRLVQPAPPAGNTET